MRGLRFIIFCSLVVPAFCLAAAATLNKSKGIIAWAVPENPQFSVTNNGAPLTARGNSIISYLSRHLPEYDHTTLIASIRRILVQIQKNENTCLTSSLEDRSRLEFSYWTSYGILPPPMLVVRKETVPLLKVKNGKVSLLDLIKTKKFRGGARHSRSFGPEIDEILKALQDSKPSTVSFDFFSQNLLEMISRNRIDYSIEHQVVFNQYIKAVSLHNLVALPILEANKPLVNYIICSRTKFGKTVIEKIDRIVRENILSTAYEEDIMKAVLLVSPDEQFRISYEKYRKARSKKVDIE